MNHISVGISAGQGEQTNFMYAAIQSTLSTCILYISKFLEYRSLFYDLLSYFLRFFVSHTIATTLGVLYILVPLLTQTYNCIYLELCLLFILVTRLYHCFQLHVYVSVICSLHFHCTVGLIDIDSKIWPICITTISLIHTTINVQNYWHKNSVKIQK